MYCQLRLTPVEVMHCYSKCNQKLVIHVTLLLRMSYQLARLHNVCIVLNFAECLFCFVIPQRLVARIQQMAFICRHITLSNEFSCCPGEKDDQYCILVVHLFGSIISVKSLTYSMCSAYMNTMNNKWALFNFEVQALNGRRVLKLRLQNANITKLDCITNWNTVK